MSFFSFTERRSEKFLVLFLALPILITVLTLSGGIFFQASRLLTAALIIFSILVIVSTIKTVFIRSVKFGLAISAIYCVFIHLLFRNYTPVIFGGQDPAYYSAFSKVLARGLGSPFPSKFFEQDFSLGTHTLWSTYTNNGLTEIQFYPMLPSLMSGIDALAGNYTYPLLASIGGLLISTFILKNFENVSFGLKTVVICIWLFMPATLWFSRTPSSEIISVILVSLVITMKPDRSNLLTRNITLLLITSNLALIRPNPVFIFVLIIFSVFTGKKGEKLIDVKVSLFSIVAIAIGATLGAFVYWQYLPNFGTVILTQIYYPLVKPGLFVFVVFLLVFIALVMKQDSTFLFRLKSTFFKNSSSYLKSLNLSLLILVVILLLVSTVIVMRFQVWGIYESSWFGNNFGLLELATKTPLVFVCSSFGAAIFFVKTTSDMYQTKLLLVICVFLVFAMLRNPSIPITYFYERYWWSEIALCLVFLILSSINTVKKKRAFVSTSSVSILALLFFFGLTITSQTEGGPSTKVGFERIVEKMKFDPANKFYFRDDEVPSWISQIIIPLRYYYGSEISKESLFESGKDSRVNQVLITSRPCTKKALADLSVEVGRLSKFNREGIGFWQYNLSPVYLCSDKD